MFLSLACLHSGWCSAQSNDTEPKEVNDKEILRAIRSIDSDSDERLLEARSTLAKAIKNDPKSAILSVSYLAISLALEDDDKARKVIQHLAKQKPAMPPKIRSEVGKVQLHFAILDNDKENAERLFNAVLRSLDKEGLSRAERNALLSILGTITATLAPMDELSPISMEVLKAADHSLREKSKVNADYVVAYKNAAERCKYLSEWLEKWDQEHLDERLSSLAEQKMELDARQAELDMTVKSTRANTADHRDAIRQNFKGNQKLAQTLEGIIAEQMTPTLGHPGFPPVPPEVPDKAKITVDEYKTVYRSGKEEKEKRTSTEMDRDRDSKYSSWLQTYEFERTAYSQRKKVYDDTLAAWMLRDKVRQQDLAQKRNEVEKKISEVTSDSKGHEEEHRSEAASLKERQDAITKDRKELELATLAAKACEDGEPKLAFQRSCKPIISLTQLKLAILRGMQDQQ